MPYHQQQLVHEYLQKFKDLQEELYRIDGDSAEEIEKSIKKKVASLVRKHKKMMRDACQENKENKKTLTFKVTVISELPEVKEIETLPLEDSRTRRIEAALERDITYIEKIVQTLRSISDYFCSFFENDPGRLNAAEEKNGSRLISPSLDRKAVQ